MQNHRRQKTLNTTKYPQWKQNKTQVKSPEAAPPDPVLTNILHTRRLRQKLVDLVADIELVLGLKVPAGEFLSDSAKHLQRPGILGLAGFVGNTLLGV